MSKNHFVLVQRLGIPHLPDVKAGEIIGKHGLIEGIGRQDDICKQATKPLTNRDDDFWRKQEDRANQSCKAKNKWPGRAKATQCEGQFKSSKAGVE